MTPTVLVIEDEEPARELLRVVLGGYGYAVVDAHHGREGLSLAETTSPDLIVLDLGLPDMTGLEVIRELRRWTETPILVLSSSTRRTSRADALDSGADDYLPKPFFAAELAARLRAMARRGRGGTGHEDLGQRRFGALLVDADRSRAELDGREIRLTPTQWRILEALTRHPGELMTHRWLVTQVWNATHGRETLASLRVHLTTLRTKLDDDATHPTYLRTESGMGYRWIATAGPPPAKEGHSIGARGPLASAELARQVVAGLEIELREGVADAADASRVHAELVNLRQAVDSALRAANSSDQPDRHVAERSTEREDPSS